MSDSPVYTVSGARPERRLHRRQRISALAYVDIEPGDGGIALDLSEVGMGFQAIGPLDGKSIINLRIHLPRSRVRVAVAAQIVWTTESKHQGGVLFVNMSAEGRTQIEQWIRSETWPSNASEENSSQEGPQRRHLPKQGQEPTTEPLKDELVGPKTESALRNAGRHPFPQNVHAAVPRRAPTLRDLSTRLGAPAGVLADSVQAAKMTPEAPRHADRGLESRPQLRPSPASSPPSQPSRQTGGSGLTGAASAAQKDARLSLDQPFRVSPTVPIPVRESIPRLPLIPSPIRCVEPPTASVGLSSVPPILKSTETTRRGKWPWVAALFVFFLILCLGISVWVGTLGSRIERVESRPSKAETSATSANRTTDGTRSRRDGGNPGSNQRRFVARAGSLAVETSPRHLRSLSSTPSKADGSSSKTHGVSDNSVPILESFITVTATKEQEGSAAPRSTLDDSAAPDPGPGTVAGQTLRPTDRFNPCHLIYRVEPVYPRDAQQQRIEGTVKIHQRIGADGSVRSVKLLSGPPPLVSAAMDAAQHWRYLPALLNGQPIETEQDIEIDFRLPH